VYESEYGISFIKFLSSVVISDVTNFMLRISVLNFLQTFEVLAIVTNIV
jgi:hypothetical protein